MNSPTTPDPHPSEAPPPGGAAGAWIREGDAWMLPAFLLVIWGQLFWALHYTWSHGQYYDYGWAVPPIAAWFFLRRWQQRPALGGPGAERSGPARPGSRAALAAVSLLALVAALTFLRILERFDPIWRIPLLGHAAVVFVATHVALWFNRGFRFSLAFLPLVIFALTAAPWPAQVENRIIGELTERLLAVSAPMSRAIGLPVEMSGSALVSEGRVIEIDEGCSGIRSFQSLLMAGLFVGEFMMLRWGWRAFLVVSAMAVGFVTNAMRATVLSWIFIHEGKATFDQYHDLVGFVFFGLAAVILLAVGRALDRPVGGRVAPG